jgi:predicted O-linked N-acetylglucosamine transferase (SPINDLY family)
MRERRLEEAEALCRQALGRDPGAAQPHRDLGAILMAQGRLADAEASYRRAVALAPGDLATRSTLVYLMHYAATQEPQALLAEAKAYGALAAAQARPFGGWSCERDPRRLRVGLVSGDLGEHPVGYFLERVIAAGAGGGIEWIAYPTDPETDELSARLRASLAGWRPIAGLADEEAASLIRDDGIHVLLDLSGHSVANRLALFAWRPAPVLVSWLGYFATTGVAAMDFLLADEVGVPPAQQRWFTEKIRYLPDTRLCFSPPANAPATAPLPALANGFITFGCFQDLPKITDGALRAWARVLSACPGSRLSVQNDSLRDAAMAERFRDRLRAQGIDPARCDLHPRVPRGAYLAAHAAVDVILDTFPFPGGTTTCEALWMGVPTVTLAGESMIARQGASLLTAAGLADWVADSEDDYVRRAVAHGGDLARLAALRDGLREQVHASPLFDAARFARNLERALAAMWDEAGRPRLAR